MGQAGSSDKKLTDDVEIFGEEVFRQARFLSEIATLSYEDFLEYLKKLNGLSQHCMDAEGKQLIFVIKNGTDSSLFWRSRVRIACVKINPVTMEIDSYRLMNLNEFLKVFRSLNSQFQTAQQISKCQEAVEDTDLVSEADNATSCSISAVTEFDNREPSTSTSSPNGPDSTVPIPIHEMTASILMREVDKVTSASSTASSSHNSSNKNSHDEFVECCVCLDRTPNVMLPCAHSYCKPCIEKWNVNHKTCPVCREEVKSSDDAWVVISEAPNSLEVNEELCSTLMNILNTNGNQDSTSNNIRQTRLVRNHTSTTTSNSTTVDNDDFDDDDDFHDSYHYHSYNDDDDDDDLD